MRPSSLLLQVDMRWMTALNPLDVAKMMELYHVNMDYDLYSDLDSLDPELIHSCMEAADEKRNIFHLFQDRVLVSHTKGQRHPLYQSYCAAYS